MGLVDGQVVSVLAFYPDELSSNPGVAYNGIWAYDCIIVFTGRFHFIIKESYFKIKFGLKLLKCQFFLKWSNDISSKSCQSSKWGFKKIVLLSKMSKITLIINLKTFINDKSLNQLNIHFPLFNGAKSSLKRRKNVTNDDSTSQTTILHHKRCYNVTNDAMSKRRKNVTNDLKWCDAVRRW